MIVEDEDGATLTFRGGVCVNEDDLRRRTLPAMRVERALNTVEEASAFKAGVEYVGDPEVRVLDVEERDGKWVVILEDASLRPEDDELPEAPDMADEDTPGGDAVE